MIRKLALACIAIVVALLIAEGVARLTWSDIVVQYGRTVPEQWRALPELDGFFDLAKPNQRGLVAKLLFETNAHGLRGPAYPLHKNDDTFRIVVLGDSFAMGWGVLWEDTWAARLERHLQSLEDARRFEVVDVALAGLPIDVAVERYRRSGLRFSPDLAIYGFFANDIEGEHYRKSVNNDFNPLRMHESPLYLLRLLDPVYQALREQWLAPLGSYAYELDDNYFHNPAAWNHFLAGLDRLREINRSSAICSVVLIQPVLSHLRGRHPFARHYDAVAREAAARDLHPIDALGVHRGYSPKDVRVGAIDPHPNALGHELLFEALIDGLAQVDDDCWGEGGNPLRRSATQ